MLMVSPLDLVGLTPLMERGAGRPEIVVGIIDGPVALGHPDLGPVRLREVSGEAQGACMRSDSVACVHGTFVAGILCARRGSAAPAICPECTVIVRPIFAETTHSADDTPSSTPEELARAIVDCIEAGAHVLNISAALERRSLRGERALTEALDYAASRGTIVVVAAGNQGALSSTAVTGHPWVIPVSAFDNRGVPMQQSNFSLSIGRRGLGAPGDGVISLGVGNKPLTLAGTSAAAPFVTGAAALLWSENKNATAAEVRWALTDGHGTRRTSVVPPLLNAWAAYQTMRRYFSAPRRYSRQTRSAAFYRAPAGIYQ